ncbi:MAG: methylmalonyl Co-A mutase-associated GTPase MeaB [Deltaproteobacteria bacterium]|nr:methylmalonyl Co-A mutase-associated GTPase MeaB [Deltaproteobacteria bacterium]
MFKGDKRSLARLLTYVENRHEDLLKIMAEVYSKGGHALVVGVTGPPGAGKSTLVDKMIRVLRGQGKKVGVLAIDPSSPFSGGAVLGDRIRMQDHNADEGVFIRSVGSRGAHGGLSRATRDMVMLLKAFGVDEIIIETVGVGQTELDIMSVADTTLVVLVPESGDTIQTMKAGLMEIADIFVVNKADREGADRIFNELIALSEMHPGDWSVPVMKTVAVKNDGINDGILEVIQQIQSHRTCKKEPHGYKASQHDAVQHCLDVFSSEMRSKLLMLFESAPPYSSIQKRLLENKINPYEAVSELLNLIKV